ncbi:MAG: Holliday junction branch migration protein RuvA [Clostridia bacterium]|nr:Holliday junction branch migration protein RuvA [Clostridia bacterium]
MIAYLKGKILLKTNNYLILKVDNIGYQIFIGESFNSELKVGLEREIYISHQVRAELSDLYGFRNLAELELFDLLLSVSGVGPKSALGMLSIASVSDVKEAILRSDPNLLTKVSGIGKKTAERIILDLKTKILKYADNSLDVSETSASLGDELDALMSLGYNLTDARQALLDLDSELIESTDRVKAALRKLSQKL